MKKQNFDFEKKIEQMVNPQDTSNLLFLEQFSDNLPKKIKRKMMKNPSYENRYMSFVVEPYSSFLCFEISDIEKAKKLIPENFEIIKTKIFQSDEIEKYYFIFGNFNVHTSAFAGTRLELYVIAENKDTGLLSWVIVDYATNTIGHNNKDGLTGPDLDKWVNTTNYDGNVIVDYRREKQEVSYNFNLENGNTQLLDQRLWLEGNLSVTYGKKYEGVKAQTFGLKFNIKEVRKALEINEKEFQYNINNWFEDIIDISDVKIVCFPYAQHYLSDSPGFYSQVVDAKSMQEEMKNIKLDNLSGFSTKKIISKIKIFMLIQYLFILSLIISLIIVVIK